MSSYNIISIKYDYNEDLYWISLGWSYGIEEIAEQLNMNIKDYSKVLIREYNAIYAIRKNGTNDEHRGLFFETLEDAAKAFTYVQGIIVANKLTGK